MGYKQNIQSKTKRQIQWERHISFRYICIRFIDQRPPHSLLDASYISRRLQFIIQRQFLTKDCHGGAFCLWHFHSCTLSCLLSDTPSSSLILSNEIQSDCRCIAVCIDNAL
eukprot:335816_1